MLKVCSKLALPLAMLCAWAPSHAFASIGNARAALLPEAIAKSFAPSPVMEEGSLRERPAKPSPVAPVSIVRVAVAAPGPVRIAQADANTLYARQPSAAMASPSDPTIIPRRSSTEALQPKANFFSRIKARFASLRPSWKRDEIPMDGTEEALKNTTLVEQIYNDDMNRRMEAKYREVVEPWERATANPVHPTRWDDMQRYANGQREMVKWAMKEIGQGQLNLFIKRHQGGMLGKVHEMSGAGDHPPTEELSEEEKRIVREREKKLSEAERIARAHRADRILEQQEEVVPTKFRTKLNPLKGRGQLSMSSAYVDAMVEGGAGSGENLAVEIKREFKKLEMLTKARYSVDDEYIMLNFQKRLTPEIALDLNSEHWTGEKRSDTGERSRESARVTYSLAF